MASRLLGFAATPGRRMDSRPLGSSSAWLGLDTRTLGITPLKIANKAAVAKTSRFFILNSWRFSRSYIKFQNKSL
jgi:hypothetical protein